MQLQRAILGVLAGMPKTVQSALITILEHVGTHQQVECVPKAATFVSKVDASKRTHTKRHMRVKCPLKENDYLSVLMLMILLM